MIVTFIIMNIAMIIWLYLVPLKHRKNMAKKDVEYQLTISNQNSKAGGEDGRKSPPFTPIPIEMNA
jgi:hypothetical protein